MALEEINDTLFEKLRLNLNADESLFEFLESKGIQPAQQMACVFHSDRTPSMSVNNQRGLWKCFSCGRGGSYVELAYHYYREVENGKLSKKEFLHELLIRNKEWQKKYGITSLKTKMEFSVDALEYVLEYNKVISDLRKETRQSLETNFFASDSRKQNCWDELQKIPKESEDEIIQFLSKLQREL